MASLRDMISIRDLCFGYPAVKRYREHLLTPFAARSWIPALQNLSLEIRPGQRVAILGKNGAGKTTLLKLMGGLLYPNSGEVSVQGADTVTDNITVRQRVGYVINEERSFYWRLTGQQNLEFFGSLNNLFGSELKRRTTQLLDQVGLSHAARKRVSDYSAGMRQRLALARGLLSDPGILLLDEPTKSLDPVGAEVIRELILSTALDSGRHILVVTTNQFDDVAAMCDRLCVVHQGRIAADRDVPQDSREVRQLVHGILSHDEST